MPLRRALPLALILLALPSTPAAKPGDDVPKAAWKRPIGAPLEHAGTKKPALDAGHIDDGYWQGAPVGGFGAGTFSRTYRGDFARWHIQGGVHKYQTVDGNQFAMFQKSEGDSNGFAQVLTASHPRQGTLSSWKWDYPVGAGDYYALYPKAWFDYRLDKFPAHVVLEQYSPILPDNYKESSYPIAVYRWHAENPTKKRVTVSVLLSWENMLGWFRTFSRDLSGGINAGNLNRTTNESLGSAGTMKGIVFDRNRIGPTQEAWDGQWTIAALESPGVEISYQTTFNPNGDGKDIWEPFSKDGRLSNGNDGWTSSGENIAGAIAVPTPPSASAMPCGVTRPSTSRNGRCSPGTTGTGPCGWPTAGSRRSHHRHQANRDQPELLLHHHAQRRAQRQRTIGGHAVVRNNLGRVLLAHAVMPHSVAPVDPRLSPTPSTSRLANRLARLSHVGLRCKAAAPSSSSPLTVQAPCPTAPKSSRPVRSQMRPAHGRLRNVAMYWMLITSPASAALKSHAQVHIRRQNRQRQPDRQIAYKGEVDVADNRPRLTPRSRSHLSRRGIFLWGCAVEGIHVWGVNRAFSSSITKVSSAFPLLPDKDSGMPDRDWGMEKGRTGVTLATEIEE